MGEYVIKFVTRNHPRATLTKKDAIDLFVASALRDCESGLKNKYLRMANRLHLPETFPVLANIGTYPHPSSLEKNVATFVTLAKLKTPYSQEITDSLVAEIFPRHSWVLETLENIIVEGFNCLEFTYRNGLLCWPEGVTEFPNQYDVLRTKHG